MTITENIKVGLNYFGFVNIWGTDKHTGKTTLKLSKRNTVLYSGAKLLSYALAGRKGSNIWGMYIGYNNTPVFTAPTIDLQYSQAFADFSAPFGYLREPLTLPPAFLSTTNHEENVPIFTVMLSSATKFGGAELITGTSHLYELALVAAPSPNNSADDIVFARINFNPIVFDSNENFTISWGVQFTSN